MLIDTPLKSDDLELKNLTQDHAQDYYAQWLNNPEINQFTESRFQNHTAESVGAFIQSNNDSQSAMLLGIFFENIHVGNIRAVFDHHHKTASIGIIIGSNEFQNKGLGHKSIQLLSDYIVQKMQFFKINAGLYESNIASYKAFEKAGFEQEYIKHDHVINAQGQREDVIVMVRYAG